MSIEIKQLSHTYSPGTPFEAGALRDVTMNIQSGAFVGVIGHTGSGKSTLMQHMNGLIKPTSGTIVLDGEELTAPGVDFRAVRRRVGLVFQYPEYQLFEETVEKDIAFGPVQMGLSADEVAGRVKEAAQLAGVREEWLEKSPFELSGGQKRRVAIAGVIAMRPTVLILDEPAAGLDPVGREEMLGLVSGIHKNGGVTVIMVSHSMDDVARLCDTLFVLDHGRLAMQGAPAEVFARAGELRDMGLDVPAAAQLAEKLREAGWDMPEGVFRMEDVEAAIRRNLARND